MANLNEILNNPDWKLKEGITLDDIYNTYENEDFWYAVNNGYLEPEDVLGDEEQLKKLKEAIKLVSSFESLYNDIVEYLYDEDGEGED